uniref:Cyclin-dependent kinase inhibitor domain-containing protein n=1 Tax=Eptatretus burgeri TaxID=7764 RepID=A0A8C4QEJ9_EPTBU
MSFHHLPPDYDPWVGATLRAQSTTYLCTTFVVYHRLILTTTTSSPALASPLPSLAKPPGDTTPQPVRRCLFGPLKDDHSSSQFECSNELQASIAEALRRWDFDFARNAPLSDGRERSFTWEAVPVHEVPSFYCERVPKDPRMRRNTKKEEQSSDCGSTIVPGTASNVQQEGKSPPCTKQPRSSVENIFKCGKLLWIPSQPHLKL